MKKLSCLLTFAFAFLTLTMQGQEYLILQHRIKKGRIKKLNIDHQYTIRTSDSTYSYYKILNPTDSTLSIAVRRFKAGIIRHSIEKTKDTATLNKISNIDTIIIPFSKIQYLQTDWFQNKTWVAPFAIIVWASLSLAIPALPVFILVDEKNGFKDWLLFEGSALALSVPPYILGTSKSKYDLKNKWIILNKGSDK